MKLTTTTRRLVSGISPRWVLPAIAGCVLVLGAPSAPAAAPARVAPQSALVLSGTNSEAQCLQTLQSGASLMEKDAACARLKFIGTERCVPVLATLLTDEQLSHSACSALEPMVSPKAGQALRAALDKTSGLTKIGIIDSLGIRGEAGAVPALAKALKDSDLTVAAAAATALGQIAGPEALKALQAVNAQAEPLHRAVVDASLRCAQRLLASGQQSKALAICQHVYDTESKDFLRTAAYRGIILASGKSGLTLATQALTGKPSPAQTAALQLVHELNVSGATAAFAQLLPQVEASMQVALVGGLTQRNDPVAVPAIAALMSSKAPEVRLAAIEALGVLGDTTVVEALAQTAAQASGAEQAAAREALVRLQRGKITEALLKQLSTAAPAVQTEVARALGGRSDAAAIPDLLKLAQQGSDSARQGARLALARLADQPQLAALVQLVLQAKNEDERAQAAEVLNSACQHIQSRRGHVEVKPLVDGLTAGSPAARMALLPVCAAFNTPEVRAALRASIADSNPQLRAAAIRALCDTTDAELLPDVLKLACSAPEGNLRTLAVSACVRLTTQEESVTLPNAQRLAHLKTLLDAAPSTEQKRMVLAGLARVPEPGALKLAEALLTEAPVQIEAARAIIQLASIVPDAAAVQAALNQVIATVPDAATRQAAQVALSPTGGKNGFITTWQVAGPYRQDGKDFHALFDMVFPPETTEPQQTSWKALPAGTDAKRRWYMDLLKALGGQECVAYVRTRIHCDRDQSARLELGSDDGAKVWLNRQLVHARNVARPVKPGADRVNVTLKAGWNDLLLKITQHNQGWGFCAQLVQADGSPLGGLQFDAGPQATQAHAAPPAPQRPVSSTAFAASANCDRTFHKTQLTDKFWAEGASYGDFNRDGQMDVASGPYWYEGPDFKKRHEIWQPTATFKRKLSNGTEETVPGFEGALGTKNAYSDCFFTFTYDLNNDGWPDVLVIGFPAKAAYWYENPKGAEGPWPRHNIFDEIGDESPNFVDVTGDGKPEILCCARGHLGYVAADWKNLTAPWTFHPISPKGPYQKFYHGLGCGDINGDGRMDIIEKDGWWEQPASCAGDPVWTKHPFHFADGGAQMLVYDVNGDGLNDVITCLNPHGYGLVWYEQVRTNGAITFRQHIILNADATADRYGFSFTQMHALALADMDGDGLMDIVTGKRFWAHGKTGGDPESDGFPAVLCWFQLKRSANGQAEYIPHLIDNDSGVGTQVTCGVLQKGALPGIVVGNKKGVFVFERQAKP